MIGIEGKGESDAGSAKETLPCSIGFRRQSQNNMWENGRRQFWVCSQGIQYHMKPTDFCVGSALNDDDDSRAFFFHKCILLPIYKATGFL